MGTNCPDIGRLLRHAARHDDLRVPVHGRLRVVGLHEALGGAVLHDARVGVGEVALRRSGAGRACSGSGTCGTPPFAAAHPLLPRGQLRARGRRRGAARRPPAPPAPAPPWPPGSSPAGVSRRANSAGSSSPAPPAAVRGVLGRVGLPGLPRATGRTSPSQPLLGLLHPRVAHGLVLRGVGLHLRAVQGDVPELHRAPPPGTAAALARTARRARPDAAGGTPRCCRGRDADRPASTRKATSS